MGSSSSEFKKQSPMRRGVQATTFLIDFRPTKTYSISSMETSASNCHAVFLLFFFFLDEEISFYWKDFTLTKISTLRILFHFIYIDR